MPETRRPSTRLKSERHSKRRASTPPTAPPPKSKKKSLTPVDIDDELPTKIKDGQVLPTLRDPQPSELSNTDFQSISESGVLGQSVEQSRQRWLMEGLFDKCWVKPTKKTQPLAGQPDRTSMTKLGTATLIIDPHHFEILLHSVKGAQPQAPSQPQNVTWMQPQNPSYPAPMSYAPPYGGGHQQHGTPIGAVINSQQPGISTPHAQPSMTHGPVPSAPTSLVHEATPVPMVSHHDPSVQQVNQTLTAASSQPILQAAPEAHPVAQSGSESQVPPVPSVTPSAPTIGPSAPYDGQLPSIQPAAPPPPTNGAADPTVKQPGNVSAPTPREESTGGDPVIQMLAARAAEDQTLKALMKIVAAGAANQEQLAIFQRHIDELNAIINEKKRKNAANGTGHGSYPNTLSAPAAASPPPRPSIPAPVMTPAPPPRPIHPASAPVMKHEPLPQYYNTPQPIKSKGSVPLKQDISAILFEFTTAPSTRYAIPKNSIVEYVHGTPSHILVSFIITRKGSKEYGGKYREDKEYYQPVTMKLQSSIPKLWELVSRAVGTPDEVRKQMTGTMEKLEIAEDVYLATRLPRTDGEGSRPHAADLHAHTHETGASQDIYGPPNSILSMR